MAKRTTYEIMKKRFKELEKEYNEVTKKASDEQRLIQTLLDFIPDYVYFKDKNRRFVRASSSFCNLFKCSLENIIGKKDEDLFPEAIAEETVADDRRVIETGVPLVNKEEGGDSIGGEAHWVLTTKVPWLDRERNIIGLFGISKDITERRQAEKILQEKEIKLARQAKNLEEVNIALKVLLNQRDKEKAGYKKNLLVNLKKLVFPYIEKLEKGKLDEESQIYLNIIKSNLGDIISPIAKTISLKYLDFTPSEIQVADLIKNGKTSKEIASMLNVSPKAVSFHRGNIRKKLSLSHKKTNLRTYLQSLPDQDSQ
jgi:PAS domain S-box-containing protein